MAILFGAPVFMAGDRPAKFAESHGSQSRDYDALAAKHVAKGYAAAYAPKPPQGDKEETRAARQAFEKVGIRIAEVGCWTNLLADDIEVRNTNYALMEGALAQADELGAGCALVDVGSVRLEGSAHHDPRNFSEEVFDRAVYITRRLIDSVRPKQTKLAYEALPFNFTDTPAGYRRLFDAVERPEFAVHVDLVNWLMVSPRRYFGQQAVIEEIICELGPWIVGAHCKDLKMQVGYEQHIVEVQPGQGNVDYRAYLKALDSLPQDVTLLLEHLPDEQSYDAAVTLIRAEAIAAGVRLRPPTG